MVHPDWLNKKVREKEDKFRQRKLIDIFSSMNKDVDGPNVGDVEDFAKLQSASGNKPQPIVRSFKINKENCLSKPSCSGPEIRTDYQRGNVADSRHPQPLTALHQNGNLSDVTDRNIDYDGWLQSKKRKWKEAREERKKRR